MKVKTLRGRAKHLGSCQFCAFELYQQEKRWRQRVIQVTIYGSCNIRVCRKHLRILKILIGRIPDED